MGYTLYPHQREAVDKLDSGCILCGGVGTGKSMTALYYYIHKERSERLFIITTARKRDTHEWEKEIERFSMPRTEITIDSWNNIRKYDKEDGAFFIFDEQRVVGSGSWVRSFLKITKRNRWILLSATPGDTWMDYIPVFVANGFYKNRTEFLARHAVYNRFSKYPKVDKYLEVGRLEKLRRMITVTMKFEKDRSVHDISLQAEYDREAYDAVIRDRWDPYEQKPLRDISQVCYMLRKVVNSDPRRLGLIETLLAKHGKLIVFYNYDYELEMLRAFLDDISAAHAEWNGHRHEAIPSGDRWVYLVQYTAGCEGWNCVETDTIIFYSRSYSYKQMTQAAGRIDRLNSPYTELYYYTMETTSSIDRAISHALRSKKTFNETLFAETVFA